eukprot:XP_011667068.1 PREDICTED: uncharacterized protein LOC105439594 [Strongylocentrotus purpuratus]
MASFHHASIQKEFGTADKLPNSDVPFPPVLSRVLNHSESDTKIKETEAGSTTKDEVIISYYSDDQKFVDFIYKLLESNAPGLVLKAVASDTQDNLASLDKASCIVPILSPSYIESPECVEEFHVAIWRQRVSNPDALMLPVQVHSLPQKPTYFHLVHSVVNTTDDVWA